MNEKLIALANEMSSVAQKAAVDITEAIDAVASSKLEALIADLAKLTGKGGKFSATSKTLFEAVKVIQQIEALGKDAYMKKALGKYIKTFETLALLNNGYINLAFDINTKSALAEDVTASALLSVTNTLSADALRYTVGSAITATVKQTILSKGTIGELEQALKQVMFGSNDAGGMVDSAISRIARDSIFQYNRDYLNAISAGIDIEYYLYAGSERKSSRQFCKTRNNEIWSKDEVLSWQNMNWQGKKDGNIFSVAGGYNCVHRLLPYPADLVKK